MCKISQTKAVEIIQGINSFESGEKLSDSELSKIYLGVYELEKEMKNYKDSIKKVLIERRISPQYFSKEEKKVLLSEGRSSTGYDMNSIIKVAVEKNLLDELSEVSTIHATNLKEYGNKEIAGIVEVNSWKEVGNDTIKVAKMTKKELQEQNGGKA